MDFGNFLDFLARNWPIILALGGVYYFTGLVATWILLQVLREKARLWVYLLLTLIGLPALVFVATIWFGAFVISGIGKAAKVANNMEVGYKKK